MLQAWLSFQSNILYRSYFFSFKGLLDCFQSVSQMNNFKKSVLFAQLKNTFIYTPFQIVSSLAILKESTTPLFNPLSKKDGTSCI